MGTISYHVPVSRDKRKPLRQTARVNIGANDYDSYSPPRLVFIRFSSCGVSHSASQPSCRETCSPSLLGFACDSTFTRMPYVLRYSQYLSYASLGFFVSLFVVTFLIAQILKRYIRYHSVNYAVRFLSCLDLLCSVK